MEAITQNLFYDYKFLSNLQLSKDKSKLAFVETKCDLDNNDYLQRLHVIDTASDKEVLCTSFTKRYPYFMMDDNSALVIKPKANNGISTHFVKLNLNTGEESDMFDLKCQVSSIKDFNDDYYVISATINQLCPDYHKLNEDKQKAYEKQLKDNEDYVIFDEYPFFFNGAGIINGDRNTLFLVDKKTYEILDIVSSTVDVESFDIADNKIVFSGVDFDSFKGKYSHIWEYDHNTRTTTKIYDDIMQIYRCFYLHDKIMVLGTFAKEYGAMEAGKFYILDNGQMEFVIDNEYSMYNSVGSDCRYGHGKNFAKDDNGDAYFITSANEGSIVVKIEDNKLKTVVDYNGSCDDMAIGDDIYVIGLDGQKLQEVYKYRDNKLIALTALNAKVLSDKYVAKPEKVVLNKESEVVGWVLKPKDFDVNKKYPAIMDIHGGPKTNYGEVFYHEMQYWANLGYFVFFCNPRGSDGKGNKFADLRRNFGKIDYEDLMDFVDEVLKQYPNIDSDRLGVTGGSYGGYMTNWIIGHTDRFKAAASQRSISNWITEVCASDYGIDFPIEQEFDDINNCQEELWDMSPLKYANNAVTPTLFIQSTEDYRCPICEAIQMYTVLKCRGVESKLVGFKGENHELSRSGKPLHRSKRLFEITNWMEIHLK